jgi:CarD family transcriptional regulator
MVAAAFEATRTTDEPDDTDPFQRGESVVYPTHGVGRVDRVGVEEIGGFPLNVIHISFDDNRMTLLVPIAKARAAGLRKLVSEQRAADVFVVLAGRPRIKRSIWARRAQEFLAKIYTGDFLALAEVVRDLQSPEDGSAGSSSQRSLYELALDRLAGEYAAIRGIAKGEAVERFGQAIVEARTGRVGAASRKSSEIQ